jgi:fatty-acyl-CoA synthase
VRLVDQIPLTGSNKVNKTPLRRQAWVVDDPVFVRVGRTTEYVPLDAAGRAALEEAFAEHGRAHLVPAPAEDAPVA